MWNSGGKDEWVQDAVGYSTNPFFYGQGEAVEEGVGGLGPDLTNPNATEGHVEYPLRNLFPLASGQAQYIAQSLIPELEQRLRSAGERSLAAAYGIDVDRAAYERALGIDTGDIGEEALFGQATRRWREQMLPSLSARGVLTSGPGIKDEQLGLEDLINSFNARQFERGMSREQLVQGAAQQYYARQAGRQALIEQATQGLGVLMAMPVTLREALISAIVSGGTPVPIVGGQSDLGLLTDLFRTASSGGGGGRS
jgi:hypothetical protein